MQNWIAFHKLGRPDWGSIINASLRCNDHGLVQFKTLSEQKKASRKLQPRLKPRVNHPKST